MRGTYLPTFSGCGGSRFGPALAVVVLALLAGSPAFAAQANGGSQGSGGNSNNGSQPPPGQATDTFPFGHESDSHVGLFAYYPDLTEWANPDWWTNPDDAHMKPPIAQIFCDQLGEKRGWIVFYVHEWKPDYGKFPTDSSHPRWIQLQNALAFAYQRLGLIPILRLHWLDNTGDSVEGWPSEWGIVPPGQHWSVPVDTETYDSLRGATPEDPGYQDVALLMRSDYINWCTQLARSLRNECRWFIIGNELNHPAEYGNHETIVPPYWYASLWADCFAGMGRDEYESGGPTKCQVLVAALTPHSPSTAGQPWQDKLRDYAKAVDLAYRGRFGDALDSLLPGFAIHGYPDGYESSSGDCEEHPIMNQFSQYLFTIENTVHDDGLYPVPTIAAGHPTEYIIDEYNSWTSADVGTTPYHMNSIRGILDHVSELRSTWAPNQLRAACYYAYRVPHYGSDPCYDLVEQDGFWPDPDPNIQKLKWKKSSSRDLNIAYDDLLEYTGCTPPSEWCGYQFLVFPDGTPVVGDWNNVLDGDPETYVAARRDSSPGPYLHFDLVPCDLEASYVVERISVKIYVESVESQVTNANVWIIAGDVWGDPGPDTFAFEDVTLNDGCTFSVLPPPRLIENIRVIVDCGESTGDTGLHKNIGVRDIKIVNAPPPPITVSDNINIYFDPITQTSRVCWTTDVASTSRVDYGTTTDYGSYSYDDAEVTSHMITLTGLSPGTTYYYKVTSTCNNYEDGIEFGQFTMPVPATIERSPATLTQSCTQGSNAASQSFTVRNSGGGTLNYSITDDRFWLSCFPTSGTSTGETDTITVNYSTSGLSAGTYYGWITITGGATNNPQNIVVILTVTAQVPISNISWTHVAYETPYGYVRITWNTPNVLSDGGIEWGTTTSYGQYTATMYDPGYSHEARIADFTPGTTYHFRVNATASGYATTYSGDYTFNVPKVPVPMSNWGIGSVTTNSAVIHWETPAVASTSRVDYGTTTNYGQNVYVATPTEQHTITLTGLSPNTTYHCKATSTATNYNPGVTPDMTFTTTAASGFGTLAGGVFLDNGYFYWTQPGGGEDLTQNQTDKPLKRIGAGGATDEPGRQAAKVPPPGIGDRTPLGGATVTVAGLSAVSSLDGSYTILGIPAGTYTATCDHPDRGTLSATVTITANGIAFKDWVYNGLQY